MADGVALAEEQLDELLIDDGDRWRSRRVLQREAAAHDNMGANRIEVFRGTLHPGCTFVDIRIALHLYPRPPIVRLHWRVGSEADFDNTGDLVEAKDDAMV